MKISILNNKLNLFAAAIFLLCAGAAQSYADENTPLLYSRSHILILRKNPPNLPWQQNASAATDTGALLDIEVRDAATYYNQRGWFNLSSPSPNGGVMLAFGAPTLAGVTPSSQYPPLDVLMINDEGTITQIIPNLVLADLKKEIMPAKPVLAILFLKGGACKTLSINPGDEVDYRIFKKPPAILSMPSSPAPAGAHP